MTTKTVHRGLHVAAGILVLLAATVIAFGVIPDVRADKLAGAGAVPSFWVTVVCNVLVGIAVLAGAFTASTIRRRWLLGGAATLAFLIGIWLLDAAAAGITLNATTTRIVVSVVADLTTGALIVLVALLRTFSPSLERERDITATARMLTSDRPGTTIEDNWSEAVDMYNRRNLYPSVTQRERTMTSSDNGGVGADNGDLVSTRST